MKPRRLSTLLSIATLLPLLACSLTQSLLPGEDNGGPISSTGTSSPLPPTSTSEPTATLPAEPTALPGSLVWPISEAADSIPWLPMDPSVTPLVDFIGFNHLLAPFDDVLVRKAFVHATNRQLAAQMASSMDFADARPATTLTPPETLGRGLC